MGAEGSCAVDGRTGETAEVPGITVDALDPTGAGDVYVAGFVTGTLAGWPLADRLAFAGLTAALSVQEFGGSLSAPGWPEVAHWWRAAPEALRPRYAFLDALVPPGAETAPGAGRSRPSASATRSEGCPAPGAAGRGKPLGDGPAESYPWYSGGRRSARPLSGRYVQATVPAHDSDTHSPDTGAGAGASPLHRSGQAPDGHGARLG